MLELKRQIAIFAEHKTEAGSVSYYAPGAEHDDGVMALMINIQKVKQYLKPGGRGSHVIGQVPEITHTPMTSTGLGFN